jgi:hypothetical protein
MNKELQKETPDILDILGPVLIRKKKPRYPTNLPQVDIAMIGVVDFECQAKCRSCRTIFCLKSSRGFRGQGPTLGCLFAGVR